MPKLNIERLIINNLAPFDKTLDLKFEPNQITVLSAINGKGKTTIISYIVDAFHEIAKIGFSQEFKAKETYLYRTSSAIYLLDKTQPGFVYIRFKMDDKIVDYIYAVNNTKNFEVEYNRVINLENKIPYSEFSSMLEEQDFIKQVYFSNRQLEAKESKQIFNNNVLTYFPSYRNELPPWLNEVFKSEDLEFSRVSSYSGFLPNKIEVVSNIHYITNWMLDVVLDYKMYGGNLLAVLNRIIYNVLKQKGFSEYTTLNIGTRHRSATRLSIIDEKNKLLYPNFYNMSSGELAVIDIFIELIKQYDKLYPQLGAEFEALNKISGVVLIDEIEKHLHIRLQKEVLPVLIGLFPNVQFIISSHSPFFCMGLMQDSTTEKRSQIINLDKGGLICPYEATELYEEAYNLLISDNERFKEKYDKIKSEISKRNKHILITEGKTDIKHLKTALAKLNVEDLDIDFIEVPDNFGESNLKTFLENIALNHNTNKIIGIFDRDIKDTVEKIETSQPNGYKSYGNNVYGFCIPKPFEGADRVSIEHYYGETAKTINKDGRRLFFGDEFSDKTSYGEANYLDNTREYFVAKSILKNDKIDINAVIDSGVYKITDGIHSVALSKNDFADLVASDLKDFDWRVFMPIFEKIKEIIQL